MLARLQQGGRQGGRQRFIGGGQRVTRGRLVPRAYTETKDETQPSPQAAPAAVKKGFKEAILLQGFGWDSCDKGGWYKTVTSKVDAMKEAGITHLWLPPPSQSVSRQGYMPGQLYNLNTAYGSKEELVSLIQACKAAGISPMADIVINHRCADELGQDGKWNSFRDDVDHTGKKLNWGKWAIVCDDADFGGTGNPDTGASYGPAPDLDHANPELRAALKEWLVWLQNDIGFEGWRLDFVKGYAAKYVKEYISATVGSDVLCVGEDWVDMQWEGSELGANQDEPRQKLCNFIDANGNSCGAFDFPTKGILQEAAKKSQYWRLRDGQGKPSGLIGWWPARAVTFVDNHDTGSTQKHWAFPEDKVGLGYAYILTHPGNPCVFWDHLFTWGPELSNQIRTLMHLRARCNIVSDSKVEIKCAESDMYVAVIDDRVAVKLGSRYDMGSHKPSASDGWKKVAYGKDFCVWEKTDDNGNGNGAH